VLVLLARRAKQSRRMFPWTASILLRPRTKEDLLGYLDVKIPCWFLRHQVQLACHPTEVQ
jgi:hypothetical protein